MHPARRAYVEDADEPSTTTAAPRTIALEDLPDDHDYDIPMANSGIAPEKASAILSQLNRKRIAATLAVPTDDVRVRAKLRELGEPITFFGEGPADRRQRLREHLTTIELATRAAANGGKGTVDTDMQDAPSADGDSNSDDDGDEEQEEEFYSRGGQDLLDARIEITKFSLPRAKKRIEFQKQEATIPLRTHVKFRKQIKDRLQGFEEQGSQIVGERNISMVRFSPDGDTIAVGNWGGSVKLVDNTPHPDDTMPKLDVKMTLRGHTSNIGGIAWHPHQPTAAPESLNLASSAADGKVHLWSLAQDTPIGTLAGHHQRVCRIEFHPMGRHLASASEDTTWRLWDVETRQELLLQEGHSRGVYAVSFNPDGSLLASAGLDSIGRVWDMRSGRTVMIMDEHIKPIHALNWGSDSYRVLSGSADGWIKCWDMRKVQRTGAIGAHTSAVSDLRWFKGADDPVLGVPPGKDESGAQIPKKSGTFFVSSGFDRQVKVFSADDWTLVQTLSGHEGPVSCVDVSSTGKWIVSGSHDRTIKLWGRNDAEGI